MGKSAALVCFAFQSAAQFLQPRNHLVRCGSDTRSVVGDNGNLLAPECAAFRCRNAG